MSATRNRRSPARLLALSLALLAFPAFGETLKIPEGAPWIAQFGASAILVLHIAGGAIGILTGWIASFVKKGKKAHRISGQAFFISMFISYLIAACVAPFLDVGSKPNTVAAILALYLLLTGIGAARRRQFKASNSERIGVFAALLITAMGIWFAFDAAFGATGTVDGTMPEAFAVFIVTGVFAVYGDARVLNRGKLTGAERVKRHLWRMCASFFIASGSFFVGQPQVFPGWFNETPLPNILSFAPILIMIFFLVRYSRTPKRASAAS